MNLLILSLGMFLIFSSMGIGVWIWERMEYRRIEKYQARQYRIFRKCYRDKCREYIENFEKRYE